MPPAAVQNLRCASCVHFYEADRRCGLIAASEGEVKPEGCCRFWYNPEILAEQYPAAAQDDPKATLRRPTMRPPDLGRLLTKAEAAFAEDVETIQGCGDCAFFKLGGTCTLIGEGTVEADGACSAFWRSPRREADDPGLHAEFKEPPPELRESGFWARLVNLVRGD